MFDDKEVKFPQSWQEMALDLKLVYVFSLCVMLLWMVSKSLTIQWQFTIVGVLLLVMASVAIRHRVKARWHWPGVGVKGVLGAVIGGACGLFFLAAAATRISPLEPQWFPWFAFGGGVILFGVLANLNVLIPAESGFRRCCGEQPLPEQIRSDEEPREPSWKRALRGAFGLCGLVVTLVFVGYFWQLNVAVRDAAPQPTPPKTELLEEHWFQKRNQVVYVTPTEKSTIKLLEQSAIYGLLSMVGIGLVLHFLFGVKMDGGRRSAAQDNQSDPTESPR